LSSAIDPSTKLSNASKSKKRLQRMIVHGCPTQSADDILRDMELAFRQMQEQRRLPSQEHKMIRSILLIRSPEKGATVTESSEIREFNLGGID
jgi:hypothetical protein